MMIRADQPKPVADRPVVLAIDDDQTWLELVAMILQNYEVVATSNGADALEVVRSRRVDCVLLDLVMPGIDGLQLLTEIKAVDPGLDVILVSGVVQPQAVSSAMKRGAFEYVVKPFGEEELLRLVAEAVSRRDANGARLLLISADAGVIASIAVILEPHMTVATAVPRLDTLPDPGRHAPLAVVYDAGVATPTAANFLDRLRERYSRSKLVVLADSGIGQLAQPDITVIAKPVRLHDLLQHITILAPRLGELSVRLSRLGAPLLQLMDFVAKAYRQPLRAQDLARAAGCSVHHLGHIAHEQLAVPLMEYLTQFRLEVARHLLTTTRLTIDHIAAEAGFSSASHLSRTFLGHSGYRPGDYRRRVRAAGMWPPETMRPPGP
jgi:DNA-binding NarL/FixJ family response regulator/AraC-like DNA-binding protein